jgi:hypothetical protein
LHAVIIGVTASAAVRTIELKSLFTTNPPEKVPLRCMARSLPGVLRQNERENQLSTRQTLKATRPIPNRSPSLSSARVTRCPLT